MACPNLGADHGCTIHASLRGRGFPGCVVFDCFGAGQHLIQVTVGARARDEGAPAAQELSGALGPLRQVHELLWYLTEALELLPDGPLRDRVTTALVEAERLRGSTAAELRSLDAGAHRVRSGALLGEVSETLRRGTERCGRDAAGADLVGKDLRRRNLRGATLRGAYLIGADLRGSDLERTDLLGADLRAADLRGTRLHTALFLTQPQLDASRGDGRTRLPRHLQRPRHWPT